MKKNGFTLVEVITVIVVLGIIILIAVPSYLGISENLKQREYDNKVKQIEIKATEWATDNNITDDATITISKLIDDGYVNMDDETSNDKRVINPLNKESMECYHVEIIVDNGKYKAKVKESEDCELKDVEEQDKNINVVAYEIDSSTNTILSNKELDLKANELPWSGKDVLLLTTSEAYENPSSITYSSGSTSDTKSGLMYSGTFQEGDTIDVSNYQNLYIVSANVILKSKYNIIYEMESEKPKKQILIKIDKENPNGSYRMLEKWGTSETKKVLLSGNDGVGSGVKGFYVNTENTIDKAEYIEANEKNEATITKAMGTYYYWIEDNVGNRNTEANILNVTNIDDTAPTCVYRGENTGGWTNQPVTITWGCSDNESGCVTKKQSQTFNNGVVTSFTIPTYEIVDVAGNKTECGGNTVDVKFDNVKPTCDPSKDHLDTPDGVTMHLRNCRDDGSGVKDNPGGDYGGQKSTRTFTVTDHAGNSQSYTIEVSHYQMYWRQYANSCRHINFGCDLYRYGSGAVCGTYSCNCSNRGACTKYSYETGGGMGFSIYEGSSCPNLPSCSDGPTGPSGNITKCLASCTCIARARVCDTCNYSCRNAAFGCETESQGTGGAECGWHDGGWERNSCGDNTCKVTNEQTWYA